MFEIKTKIVNPSGLHARPAAEFVAKAKEFKSRVTVRRGDEEAVNAKSIIMLMSAALVQNDEIIISAKGEDEEQAAAALKELVDSGFGE